MSELSDKIRAITLAFNEREIARSMKESRFLREMRRSRDRNAVFTVHDGDGSFPVLESAGIPHPVNTVTLRKITKVRTFDATS